MSEKIKVIQYGLGPIGNLMTQYLAERKRLEIVGAVDIDPQKVGRDAGELAGLPPIGVEIADRADELMAKDGADIAVLTTSSSLEAVKDQILGIVGSGVNVVSTCEELTYPWNGDSFIAEQIDRAAREAGVSVLGTGVNPGFLMDLLPVVMTGVCREVKSVTVERIQKAESRRLPFQKKIGAGLSPSEFHRKAGEGAVRHVGLTESIQMIAAKLGWRLDRTEDLIQPVVAKKRVKTKAMTIEAGDCLGINQTGRGIKDGKQVITLVFRAVIGEPEPRDRVHIFGDPEFVSTIPGGVNGDVATCAIVVNAIPNVVAAPPGLRTMADIEPVSCLR